MYLVFCLSLFLSLYIYMYIYILYIYSSAILYAHLLLNIFLFFGCYSFIGRFCEMLARAEKLTTACKALASSSA